MSVWACRLATRETRDRGHESRGKTGKKKKVEGSGEELLGEVAGTGAWERRKRVGF